HQMTSKPISANLWINAKNRVMDKVFENAKFMHTTKHKDKKGDTRNDVQLKSYLFDKLGSKSHFDSVFDKKNLSNFITEFYGGKHNNYAAILKVASIYKFEELFLKLKCSSFPTEAESLLKKIPYQPLKG
ncbi:MAG: hypothetical protein ACE5FU_06595, partial [Nitrospinota bacterium]